MSFFINKNKVLPLSDSQTLLTSSDRKMNYQQANCRELASSFVKALSASTKEEKNSRNTLHQSKIRNQLNNGSMPALRATRFKHMPSQRHWEDKLHKRPSGSCTPASHKYATHLLEQDPSPTAKIGAYSWHILG